MLQNRPPGVSGVGRAVVITERRDDSRNAATLLRLQTVGERRSGSEQLISFPCVGSEWRRSSVARLKGYRSNSARPRVACDEQQQPTITGGLIVLVTVVVLVAVAVVVVIAGNMADRDSASESDSSSIDGGPIMMPPSPVTREQLQKRIESLQQHNRVLKVELETYKLRVKALQEENRGLRQASVIIQAKAEQEEEFISNTLLKKIQALKKEKETLAHHYEQEEECLTNDLSRKLNQLRQEKCRLEQTLEQEQECLVNKLMRKIEKLEAETLAKQSNLEQLRREKVELENTLEQEQEALVNKLWKRMDKLEAEKRMLQIKLDQPVSDPTSPREINNGDTATNLSTHIQTLRSEVARLKHTLLISQQEHTEKMKRYVNEEKQIREENLRLQRKLQLEVERREALCRHLSESESSLEMEEERHYNEIVMSGGNIRTRTVSSPVPYNPSPSSSRPLSPGSTSREGFNANRCYACGQPTAPPFASSSPPSGGHIVAPSSRRTSDRFVKPAIPPTIVSPGGPPAVAPNPMANAASHPGSPMDIVKT